MSEPLSISYFSEHLNSKFQMQSNDTSRLDIELVEVKQHGSSQSPYQFSLRFAAPLTAPLSQGAFTLEHEKLGEQYIFLVPVDRDDQHLYYEAVFNNPQD
jgi:hypothetical protein